MRKLWKFFKSLETTKEKEKIHVEKIEAFWKFKKKSLSKHKASYFCFKF